MRQMMRRQSGFTLLEILIATGIFMTVMVVAVGIFTLSVSGSSNSEQLRISAQSARFAFEAMSREVRLARGLSYTSPADNVPKVLIPPFDVSYTNQVNCQSPVTNQATVHIYQTEVVDRTDDGKAKYTVRRLTYYLDATDSRIKLKTDQVFAGAEAATASAISAALASTSLDDLGWQAVGTAQAVLPSNLTADQFRVVCFVGYPASGQPFEGLTQQPFIQLDMTVQNERYNRNKEEEKQIKATLRTTIVPRSFANPLDVVQPGIEGEASNE